MSTMKAATTAQCLLLFICCLLAICSLGSARTETEAETDRLGVSFCRSPAAKQLKCGWASKEEREGSIGESFGGGSVFRYGYEPPCTIYHSSTFHSFYPNIVSLGCVGRVVVRTVMKLEDAYACPRLVNMTLTSPLVSTISPITRCELELPPGDEAEASLRSKEVNCKPCLNCQSCPAEAGKWYSDTIRFVTGGCVSVLNRGVYEPVTPSFVMNNKAHITLTKFEVQSDN
ncbi:hypothetical protein V8C86DRAFT_2703028 [Haematococcus lacustris]